MDDMDRIVDRLDKIASMLEAFMGILIISNPEFKKAAEIIAGEK